MGGRKVFIFKNAVPLPAGKLLFNTADAKQLRYLLRYQSADACFEYLSEIQRKLGAEEAKDTFYYVITSILNALINVCDDLEGLNDRYGGQMNIYRRLFESKTTDQAFVCLIDLVRSIRELNESVIVGSIEANLQKILSYLEIHYCDAELSLESLARAVNFSVSYICGLLKKKKDTTFIKLVTALRMEKAKELLKNPHHMIIDVAECLGYNDPYYFSHCFKKYTGVSPTEYRKNE